MRIQKSIRILWHRSGVSLLDITKLACYQFSARVHQTPIDAIKIRIDDLGLQPKDRLRSIGKRGLSPKVLRRKLPLSLAMVRKLSLQLHLSADVLIKEIKQKAA